MKAHPERIAKGLYWDRSLTLVAGCTPVSPACDHCWSATEAHMRAGHPHPDMRARGEGLVEHGRFNGKIRLLENNLDVPGRVRTPKVWAVWNDLFHEDVPGDYQLRAFAMLGQNKRYLFIVLTKRPERLMHFCAHYDLLPVGPNGETGSGEVWAANIWPGITAENQEWFDRRWHFHLAKVPAPVKVISCEPALGPLALPDDFLALGKRGVVACGGESGSKARPMHPLWPRMVRDQCLAHGVNFFFKGWGEWIPDVKESCYPPDSRIRTGGVTGARCEHGYVYRRRRRDGLGFRYLEGQLYEGWPE